MWKIEKIVSGPDAGRWEWMQVVTSHGLVQGISDTREEAERDLKLAWYDLLAED